MEGLRAAVQDVESTLASWDLEDKNDPFFTIVFDEVWSLMGDSGNEQFIALNRILSVISEEHKIWYLFLSMELKLDALLRALPLVSGPNQPSSRLAVPLSDPPLERYPPFTSFAVDMKDLKCNMSHGREGSLAERI
ncbi:hypothetical protein SI65_03251 [Aspergillus cristatus]|uniref:Uncharacterized protein n=1 Tax=Aspergillus cristatus TaxID=573508 RepID=A0A1E3BN71_ASPCR|nr:hypothetical protein SI65_03251 [Aspergillus cristatus]